MPGGDQQEELILHQNWNMYAYGSFCSTKQ